MNYFFRAEKMTVGYHNKPLIENVEFALKKGEILTLIGPNGAGKSTILKSLTGQLELIAGTVYIGEGELLKMPGNLRSQKMAVVFTKRLHSELMTCEDVVATGRYPYTGRFGLLGDEDRRIIRQVMDMVNVTAIKDQDFTRISDGQRQRVMLARAICQEPEIIVLDEPTSYLDVRYKLEFLSILQRMKREKNLTVIMSLHELELAERVSDKILCINGRYVDRYGTPREIFTRGYISDLFSIESGSYDEESEDMELVRVDGEPKVFVIAGAGSGRRTFRELQRKSVPFAAGIISRNDLDYPAAKALAAKVLAAESFEPVDDETLQSAKEQIARCDTVICCREHFGTQEAYNEELWKYAQAAGKQIYTAEAWKNTRIGE